jgi:hypothetical protein
VQEYPGFVEYENLDAEKRNDKVRFFVIPDNEKSEYEAKIGPDGKGKATFCYRPAKK